MNRVSVHIVTWNSLQVLPEALESLRSQTFKEFSLTVVDNASTDDSVKLVREAFPEATVLRNFKNLGFSRAHNQAIELARGRWAQDDKGGRPHGERYVLVMNPDVILTPDFLKNLAHAADGRPEIGSLGGKLLRATPKRGENDDPVFSQTIDSIGLTVKRDRRTVDRASGEKDEGQHERTMEVFGVSGALALYRLEALDEAAALGEAFDEDFFAYKEDVDLAWRLRLLGWKAAYVPQAVAFHYRTVRGVERAGPLSRLVSRVRRSSMVNRLSTRNHLLLLAKNEEWVNFLLDCPFIVGSELAKFLTVLFTSPGGLSAYFQALRLLPAALRKRRRLMPRRKASAKEIRKWFR